MKYEIYSGAGNDFVMINNLEGRIAQSQQAQLTERICREYFKDIDGAIFLEKARNINALIMMNYYNRDGSFGAMCGNGARCIVKFAADNGIVKEKSFNLEAVDKLYSAEIVGDDLVKINFPPVSDYKLDVHIELGKELTVSTLNWIDVGSEHIVVFLKNIISPTLEMDSIPVNKWGSLLRFHEIFQPKGANVNFAEKKDENQLRIRTYERGVERETLACGTGIIASAIIGGLLGYVKSPVRVAVQSGEILTVEYSVKSSSIENVSLTGSARKIKEGELLL